MALSARYLLYCPNCQGTITEERLKAGLACERCQPKPDAPLPPGRLSDHRLRRARLERWCTSFREKTGLQPWPLQRVWAARVVSGHSFAMVAPTGIGKTTFGLVTAAWLSEEGKRSYLIFPTRLLVRQAAERLQAAGADFTPYLGKKREREAIFTGACSIALFTVAFLNKHHQHLPRPVDFLFVDDVDSLLKSARNVDRVLKLLGFGPEEIEEGFRLMALRRKDPMEAERRADELRKRSRGVMAVSSATAQPRSRRVQLFRELLGFEVASPSFSLRKVVDLYETDFGVPRERLYERAERWIRRLGSGGLLFLPGDEPKVAAEELRDFLIARGVAALTYQDREAVERFRRGEAEVLIGFASWRNPLARGLDLPERVRYALFVGVPKIGFVYEEISEPRVFLRLAAALRPILKGTPLDREIERLARLTKPPERALHELAQEISNLLRDPDFRRRIEENPEVGLRFEGERATLILADLTGYLQASGRTSRLTPAGLTHGLALLLAEDEKAWTALRRRLDYLLEEPPKPVSAVDLDALMRQIDEDRARLRRGETTALAIPAETVVVESPNKARTLATFFGRPARRHLSGLVVYEVLTEERLLTITATRGHVTDLAFEGGLYGVEIEGIYRPRFHPLRRCPEGTVPAMTCQDGRPSLPDRDALLRALQEMLLETGRLYIATDPDTEGEKIGWDLFLAARAWIARLDRAEFHAVTKRAFTQALSAPRDLDERLVSAQKVRRIADRWIGFALSEILQSRFGRKTLSAGRVQTPVLGWVVDRERDARKKVPWTEVALAGLIVRFPGKVEGNFLEVASLGEEVAIRTPPPPFTTDTLLTEASSAGFPVPKAMRLAQELFEAGVITYHRTDSTHVTPEGRALARRLIAELYGEQWARPRPWGEEGTHEAIRPARPMRPEDLEEAILLGERPLTEAHVELYRLIFYRFLASQMAPAKVRLVRYRFLFGGEAVERTLPVEILEPGWTLARPLQTFPNLSPGRYAAHPKVVLLPKAERYTEGSLVAEMKRRGIGRPSTYAVTVERLLKRRYLVRRGPYLVPTRLGTTVYRYLTEEVWTSRRYVTESWTRELEALMDAVEAGEDPKPILDRLLEATQRLREAAFPTRTETDGSPKPSTEE